MTTDVAAPWFLGVRPHSWRISCADYPMQAFAHIVVPCTPNMVLVTFDLNSLFENGVMMSDIGSFLETPTGLAWAKDHCSIAALSLHQCAWVPYGCAATVVYNPSLANLALSPNQVGYSMIWTVFSPDLASCVPENLWKSITTAHKRNFEKFSTSRVWASRIEASSKFFTAVEKARKTT